MLRLLEITESQIKLLISEIRKRVSTKSYQVTQIDEYWAIKTNDEYTLSDTGKKTIEKFLIDFTVEEIQNCIDIAFNKVTVNNEGKFKYLCGILNGKLKERKHSPGYSEVLKYWNYKRPQNWKKADEGKLEYIITVEYAKRIADVLGVSLDYLVNEDTKEDVLDKDAIKRIKDIQKLPDEEKVLAVVDALVRDFKTRKAYS